MKIQALMICKNSGESIYEVLMSWSGVVDMISILINDTTDNTYEEIRRTGLPCVVYFREFKGFPETRNELIMLSRNKEYEYSIFLDDSYILVGKLDRTQLKNQLHLINVRKIVGNYVFEYPRAIIFNNNKENYYEKDIHEVINEKVPRHLENVLYDCYIHDKTYNSHKVRRLSYPKEYWNH